jgi:hypothetical protein
MRRTIAILEDNADREVAMHDWLAKHFPDFKPLCFVAAPAMTQWLCEHLDDVAACSLDHDLDMLPGEHGTWIDPGCGRDVADYLVTVRPAFGIVVHSTNVPAAMGMTADLEEQGWNVQRITPYDDLTWIAEGWGPMMRSALTLPQIPASP